MATKAPVTCLSLLARSRLVSSPALGTLLWLLPAWGAVPSSHPHCRSQPDALTLPSTSLSRTLCIPQLFQMLAACCTPEGTGRVSCWGLGSGSLVQSTEPRNRPLASSSHRVLLGSNWQQVVSSHPREGADLFLSL